MLSNLPQVAVVIPCYRETDHILELLLRIGNEVSSIYLIDDCCPDGTGSLVEKNCKDSRVKVLCHRTNQGVGAAVITGYMAALQDDADIIVKLDGDGQMNPRLISCFIAPILRGEADYTKGNRFYNLASLQGMPLRRLVGNAVLTFWTKISSGYWDLFDPTNGYTAIHSALLKSLQMDKISTGYFFESDMLFRLNILRARVVDIPMRAVYADEQSSLRISKIIIPFLIGHARNIVKRIFYNYFLRDFSIASVELILGIILFLFGGLFGSFEWYWHARNNRFASTGTVMLAVLPMIIGMQFLLSFLNYDIANIPDRAIHTTLARDISLETP